MTIGQVIATILSSFFPFIIWIRAAFVGSRLGGWLS